MSNAVRLRVFVQASGIPQDQLAGFVEWIRRSNLDKQLATMQEWRARYQEFLDRPVTY